MIIYQFILKLSCLCLTFLSHFIHFNDFFQGERRRVIVFLCPIHTQPLSRAVQPLEVSSAHQFTSTTAKWQTCEFKSWSFSSCFKHSLYQNRFYHLDRAICSEVQQGAWNLKLQTEKSRCWWDLSLAERITEKYRKASALCLKVYLSTVLLPSHLPTSVGSDRWHQHLHICLNLFANTVAAGWLVIVTDR